MVQVAEMQYRPSGWGQIAHNPVQARRWTEYAASKGDVSAIQALKNMRVQFERKKTELEASNKRRLNALEFPEVSPPAAPAARLVNGYPVSAGGPGFTAAALRQAAPSVPAAAAAAAPDADAVASAASAALRAVAAESAAAGGQQDPALVAAVEQAIARLSPISHLSNNNNNNNAASAAAPAAAAAAPAATAASSGKARPSRAAAIKAATGAAKPAAAALSYTAPLTAAEVTREFPDLVRRLGLDATAGKGRLELIDMREELTTKEGDSSSSNSSNSSKGNDTGNGADAHVNAEEVDADKK